MAVTLRTQKGTSLPRSMAMRSSSFIIISGRYSLRRPRKTAAASALPPPSPACMGMRFFRLICSPSQKTPVFA